MIKNIKLQKNGYTINHENGKNVSINGVLTDNKNENVQEWLKNNTPEPECIEEETKRNIIEAFENHTESLFKKNSNEWGYVSIERAISYKDSLNTEWNNEAVMFINWRDSVVQYFIDETKKPTLPTKEEFLLNIPKVETFIIA